MCVDIIKYSRETVNLANADFKHLPESNDIIKILMYNQSQQMRESANKYMGVGIEVKVENMPIHVNQPEKSGDVKKDDNM